MPSRLRAGLIGCGFYARNHLHAWRDLADDVDLVAVCDRDEGKAEEAAKAFDVPRFYGDAARMFENERLDFVDIVTTMPSHKALVLLAASHKVPGIVQKPFASTWQECLDMVDACRDAGVPLMVRQPDPVTGPGATHHERWDNDGAFTPHTASALDIRALAREPGERAQHPEALGRVPEGRART